MSRLLAFIAQFIVLGLALAFVAVWIRPDWLPTPQPAAQAVSYASAVNRAAPAVVSVYTRTMVQESLGLRSTNPLFRALYRDRMITRPQSGLGSGVILDESGHVVTTRHVIDGVDDIAVALWDGRVAPAEVVGTDPDTDLAVLRVDLDELPTARFALDIPPKVGDVALAIGNPFGLNHTVTSGIVSALGRGQLNLTSLENFIQTDAAINAGNSGGALINTLGAVIGINSASINQTEGAEGIGFAIPAPIALAVASQLIEYGQVRRGWIGAQFIDPRLNAPYVEASAPAGAEVSQVLRQSPAYEAGLTQGDRIVAINSEPIEDARALSFAIAQTPPGATLELELFRDQQRFVTQIEVEQQPPL
ncbi:MAG: trypsin-like peptidase domain-containing protein [Wenzhouxiangella sp.]|nr:trypsin-like peptidase domain-containing protein [Wenzhouxiangella sp.]MDR9453363.1 trypsin-like peptidase domain-containing protein [Wenzhouxiangella sp.]